MKEIANFEYDLAALPEMASLVIELLKQRNIVLFIGEVGAGKTTLIKEICSQLQVSDEVSSPTYALVNDYESSLGPIYHMDLYRLNSAMEFFEAGIMEYLESGSICFIEWPDLLLPFIEPFEYLQIELGHLEGRRRMMIKG